MKRRTFSQELGVDLMLEDTENNESPPKHCKVGSRNDTKSNRDIFVENIVKQDSNDYIVESEKCDKFDFSTRVALDKESAKSKNSNSMKDQWSSRGNRCTNSSGKLYVPKKEFYISHASINKVFKYKNNSLRTEIGHEPSYPKEPHIVFNKRVINKKETIEQFFPKTKYIGSKKISTNIHNISSLTNLNPEAFDESGKLSDVCSSANEIQSDYPHSDSPFNINVALQLSSRSFDVMSSKFKSEENQEKNVALKRVIHKEPFSHERSSNNWISLNLFEKKSVDERSNRSSYVTGIKTQTEDSSKIHSCNYSNSKEKAMSISKKNYSLLNKSSPRKPSKSDWISRGLKNGKSVHLELSIPTGDLFIRSELPKRKSSICSNLSTRRSKQNSVSSSHTGRKLGRIKSLIAKEKKRQTTLYDFFSGKCENLLTEKNYWNEKKNPNQIINNKDRNFSCNKKRIEIELKEKLEINCAEKFKKPMYDENIIPVDLVDNQENNNDGIQTNINNELPNKCIKNNAFLIPYSINRKIENKLFGRINHDAEVNHLIEQKITKNDNTKKKNLNFNFSRQQHKVQKDLNNSDIRKFNKIETEEQSSKISVRYHGNIQNNDTKDQLKRNGIEGNEHVDIIVEKKSNINMEKPEEVKDILQGSNTIDKRDITNDYDKKIYDHNKIDDEKFGSKGHKSEDNYQSFKQIINSEVFFSETIHISDSYLSEQQSETEHNTDFYNSCPIGDEIDSEFVQQSFVNGESGTLNTQNVSTHCQNGNISFQITNKMVSNVINIHNEEITSSNNKPVELSPPQKSNNLQGSVLKISYNALECVSSPILTDPECQAYLKTLVEGNIEQEKKETSHISDINPKQSDCSLIPDEILTNPINSEDNNFHQFWENMLSQNPAEYSQTLTSSANKSVSLTTNIAQNEHPQMEKVSQEGSEIFQYILSQDCTESNSLMNNAFKNMNNLSQKIMEKRNSIFNTNLNANRLLKVALNIYAQFKERSILTKTRSSETMKSSKVAVMKKMEASTWIYTMTRILDVNCSTSDNRTIESEQLTLWSQDISKKSASEADEKILLGLKEICSNSSYLYVETDDGPHKMLNSRSELINKIKTIFENILNDFDSDKFPFLQIRRQTFEDCVFINNRLALKLEENPKMIKVKYQNTASQCKFCLMMYILAKVLQVLETNSKTTRRELYYQIKQLISSQSHIDRAVKAVSCMLNAGPWDLNIVAHKGIVFGDLKITMSSNEVVDCSLPGTSIPQDVDEIVELKSSAFFILVVEKESIFYKILEEKLPHKLVRPFLMITGKGFPDLNTQLFLKKLWMVMSIPVFIFTDADPHGVNIMMTYRFGSLANAHLSQHLAVPKAQWLGVFPSEVVRLNADKQILTEIEKNVITNLLKTPYMKINKKIEEELKFMLESGYKAGIEGIIKNHTFLSEFYFPLKFHNKDLI